MSETDYFNLKLLYFLITYGKTKQKKTTNHQQQKTSSFLSLAVFLHLFLSYLG